MTDRIHVIDPDYRRRVRLHREFNTWHFHADLYASLAEFSQRNPCDGLIFASDDDEAFGPAETVGALRSSGIALPIVIYAHRPNTERVVSAMLSGALDYLAWPFSPQAVDMAFQRLATGVARRAIQDQRRSTARVRVDLLTPREREVLALVAEGCSNKEAARMLQISPRTVEIHRGNMMRKLNAQSAADAVRIALHAELDDSIQFAA